MGFLERPIWIAAVLVAASLGAACGVPADDAPRAFDENIIPDELASSDITSPVDGPARETADIYVLDGQSLKALSRPVDNSDSVFDAIKALLDGVREDEAEDGLVSAINQRTRLLARRNPVRNGVVTLDFNSELIEFDGGLEIQGLAQIVWTATSIEGVDRVQFLVDGETISVTLNNGDVTDEAVGRENYPADDPTQSTSDLDADPP